MASSEKAMGFLISGDLPSGLLVTGIEAPSTGGRVKDTERHCFPISVDILGEKNPRSSVVESKG